MDYEIGFEMNNGEIYVSLTNTKNGLKVFHEKVTEQALQTVESYNRRYEELEEKIQILSKED